MRDLRGQGARCGARTGGHDQHLLLLADDGEGTKASIIRCTITTGACELAAPLARGELMIGS